MPTSQFGAPSGLKGRLAVHVIARLTGEANRWMVDCLDVGGHDRILDVGCGPGLAVAHAAGLTGGLVVGVDASRAMVRHAARRNRVAARQGLVEIRRADAALLPYPDAHFTAAGSLNSLQFWPVPGQGLGELYRVLAPGGRVAVILMARRDDPPGAGLPAWLEDTAEDLRAAGFACLEGASRTFGGVVHRALLGFRPPADKRVAPHSTPRRTG